MKRTIARGAMVTCALIVAAAGCARRAPQPAAEAMPPEVRAAIGEWMTLVSRALPGTTADSLRWEGGAKWNFERRWIGEPSMATDDPRTDATLEWAPDGRHWIDPNMYREIAEGGGEPGYEPDSAPVLGNAAGDTAGTLAFCGTSCRHDDARWLDGRRFVLFEWGERDSLGTNGERFFAWFVTLYDLRDSTRTTWTTHRAADEAAFWRYSAAVDSYVSARVKTRRAAIARQ